MPRPPFLGACQGGSEDPPLRAPRRWTTVSSSTRCALAFSEGGFASVGHFDPLLVGRGTSLVAVVPVPPLVCRRLRVAFRRVLPLLLTSERGDVEIVPGAPHLLVAAVVDEVGAEDSVAIADEG